MPIHALFLYIDCDKAHINIETKKTSTILDISAYFNNIQISKTFRSTKPRFKILTTKQKEKWV